MHVITKLPVVQLVQILQVVQEAPTIIIFKHMHAVLSSYIINYVYNIQVHKPVLQALLVFLE